MISTYNTISFSSFEKYGKDTAEKREAFKSEINKRAKEQVNYLDFWSRLATDNVRDKLLKSQNGVPTPVWDNHNAPDGWPDRFGHRNGKPDYTPVREFLVVLGSIILTNMDTEHMHIFLQHRNRWMQFISL